GDRAVVGAWREDLSTTTDGGAVYWFVRSGSSWAATYSVHYTISGYPCGWSVAVSGNRIVYGCPGANGSAGKAYFDNFTGGQELQQLPGSFKTGNRFGDSVAFSGDEIVVGAPSYDENNGGGGPANVGLAHVFQINSDGTITTATLLYPQFGNRNADAQF